MIRPGFSFSDTPMIAAERGSSSCFSLPSGRDAAAGRRPVPSFTRMSSAVSRPPVMTSGLISHSAMSCGTHSAASAMNRRTASTTARISIRGACPRSRPVASRPTASRLTASSIS